MLNTLMFKATLLALLLSLAAAVAQPAQGRETELPFKFVDGFIIVTARTAQSSKPLSLLLDSGASTSVLSLQAAERMRIPLLAPEPVQGVGADSVAFHIPPVRTTAGRTHLSDIAIALDLSNAAAICREPIDGLLGMDFFAGRIVQIDYKAQRIRLLSKAQPDTSALRLPIQIRNGVFCVPVGVNGSKHRWTRLDTGNNDALHWVTGRQTTERGQRGNSVGFLTDSSQMIRASVQLGKKTLESVNVAPHGEVIFPGEAGLLGNGILSRYTVTIDSRNGQVLMQEAAKR